MPSLSSSFSLPPPLAVGISPLTAQLLALYFTSSYVGSLYLSQLLFGSPKRAKTPGPAERCQTSAGNGVATAHKASSIVPPITADSIAQDTSFSERDASPRRTRDHPDVIRLRMKAVSISTLASLVIVYGVVLKIGGYTSFETIRPSLVLMGIPTRSASPTIANLFPYLVAPLMFLGPIYANFLDGDIPSPSSLNKFGLIEVRNYVVGPLTEELVFRSTIISTSILSHATLRWLIFVSPLWFGIAHAHHAFEVYRANGSTRTALQQAIFGAVFQLSYTTLFGWFASYLFVRTGSILPPLASHVFCNVMGIYLPSTAVARHPQRKWSIIAGYLGGVAGFIWALRKV